MGNITKQKPMQMYFNTQRLVRVRWKTKEEWNICLFYVKKLISRNTTFLIYEL